MDLWIPFLHTKNALFYLGEVFGADNIENIGMIIARDQGVTIKELKEKICDLHPSKIYEPKDILILKYIGKGFESDKDIQERTLNDSTKFFEVKEDPNYFCLLALNINEDKSDWMNYPKDRVAEQKEEPRQQQQQQAQPRQSDEEQQINAAFAKIENSVENGGPSSCIIS